jgi:hypothetical protein
MFSYKDVERILFDIYGNSNRPSGQSIGALRGRIKNLQKIGLSPSNPGRGKRVSYHYEDLARWAICFELAEIGFDPSTIKRFIEAHWNSIFPTFHKTDDADLVVFCPSCLSDNKSPISQYNPNLSSFLLFISANDDVRLSELIKSHPRIIILNIRNVSESLGIAIEDGCARCCT